MRCGPEARTRRTGSSSWRTHSMATGSPGSRPPDVLSAAGSSATCAASTERAASAKGATSTAAAANAPAAGRSLASYPAREGNRSATLAIYGIQRDTKPAPDAGSRDASRLPDEHGRPRCAGCYPRPQRPCSTCGQITETTAFTEIGPVCTRCYAHPKRECGRCGRVRPISRRATDQTPDLCYSCDRGPLDACSQCGRLAPRRGYRDRKPICERCYEQPTRRCDFCGKTGRITARWEAGAVCSACYPRIRARPRECPGCAHYERSPGSTPTVGTSAANVLDPGAITGALAAGDRLTVTSVTGAHPARSTNVSTPCCPGPTARSDPSCAGSTRRCLSGATRAACSRGWTVRPAPACSPNSQGRTATSRTLSWTAIPRSRFSNHLRHAFVHTGALPRRDEPVEQIGAWLDDFLCNRTTAHTQVLRPFANWVVLRRAQQRARRKPTTEAAASWARQQISVAADLLTYLDNRGLELQALDQRTLDEWLAAGNSTHHTVRDFVKWAVRQRLTQPLSVPLRQVITAEQPLADDDRWNQLQRCIRDPELPLRLRVTGALVLLYGHPVSRIVAMRASQINERDARVYLKIGQHSALLPPALGELVLPHRSSVLPPRQWTGSFPASCPDDISRTTTSSGCSTSAASERGQHATARSSASPQISQRRSLPTCSACTSTPRSGGSVDRSETGPATSRPERMPSTAEKPDRRPLPDQDPKDDALRMTQGAWSECEDHATPVRQSNSARAEYERSASMQMCIGMSRDA